MVPEASAPLREPAASLAAQRSQTGGPQSGEPATVVDLWRRRVAASPGQAGFQHRAATGWATVTYQEADARAQQLVAGLWDLGLEARDRVGILAQTRIEWVVADIALTLAGAISVPIYPSSTPEQCAHIIRDAGVTWVIVEDAAQLEKIVPLVGPGLRVVLVQEDAHLDRPDGRGRTQVRLTDVLHAADQIKPHLHDWAAIVDRGTAWLKVAGQAERLAERAQGVASADPFTIIYTSGTTGEPKGVVLTHGNVAINCLSASRALSIAGDDHQLMFLPLAHVLAREVLWAVIHMGGNTALAESINKLRDNLVEIHPTFMVGVPRVFEKFYAAVQAGARQGSAAKRKLVAWGFAVAARWSAQVRAGTGVGGWLSLQHSLADRLVLRTLRAKLGLDRCRFLVSGGAPLSREIAEFFHSAGLLILEGYGLTETVGAAFVNHLDNFRFGTVGPALDVVECRIAEEDGEILLRGPSIFGGYYQNRGATAEALDSEGWFHTGDIGHLEDGFLRITDRKKDLIVLAGGKKVAPQMIENLLKARSKLVSQVMVYGDKRPYCVALVTPAEEAVKKAGGDFAKAVADPALRAGIEADITALNATLASYETIKRFAILPTDFTEASGELTPSMKVKRKVVIENHKAAIEGLYGG